MNSLRAWRKSRSLTLIEMAGRIGVSVGSLSRIERDEQWPDRAVILRIVEETDGEVTADALLNMPPLGRELSTAGS
jgi:transcriptional regulator with XRE-family HTH domain